MTRLLYAKDSDFTLIDWDTQVSYFFDDGLCLVFRSSEPSESCIIVDTTENQIKDALDVASDPAWQGAEIWGSIPEHGQCQGCGKWIRTAYRNNYCFECEDYMYRIEGKRV